MALTILGLSGAVSHDPSAALYIDGRLVAAAEEERFIRDKHAKGRMPVEAARFCLDFAGIKPGQVDAVAIPFAPVSLAGPARWHYARRYWYAPDRGIDAIREKFKMWRSMVSDAAFLPRSVVADGKTIVATNVNGQTGAPAGLLFYKGDARGIVKGDPDVLDIDPSLGPVAQLAFDPTGALLAVTLPSSSTIPVG